VCVCGGGGGCVRGGGGWRGKIPIPFLLVDLEHRGYENSSLVYPSGFSCQGLDVQC
jgi:hypothetical protein